jgi:trk system potassium uptake protein TrkA
MNIVILGAGVVGAQIADQLVSEGHDVVIIERDPERAKYVSSHVDCMVINEEGNNLNTLRKAGIEKADFFLSVVDSDEINMIACGLVESEFNVPIKIARVRNLDYSNAGIFEKSFLGINYIVNSEVETARLIANTVVLGATSDVMLFENTDVQIRSYTIDSKSYFNNKEVKNLKSSINIKGKFLIAGIIRDNEILIPSGDTKLMENDTVYLLAAQNTLTRLFIETGRKSEKFDRILIVGGGRVGKLVASYLIRTGRKITILDTNYETCKTLSEKFPEALVLNADISDEDIFEDEQLQNYDLIITTTNQQELNILAAVYAKSLGIRRAAALVNQSNYLPISNQLGIDITVSPKKSTVDAILKFIRRGHIKSVHSLFENKAEVIEFIVPDKGPLLGKSLKEITLPRNSLILTVLRNGVNEIADGNTVIQANDTIITIAKKSSIKDLEEVFLDK